MPPWKAADSTKHTRKATTKKDKRQWKDVANSVLARGGSEGSAVTQANGVIAKEKRGRKPVHSESHAYDHRQNNPLMMGN